MEGDQVWQGKRFDTTDFYPRPHMEGDIQTSTRDIIDGQFLPTPSHGGRLATVDFSNDFEDFYPRPHMEGDLSGAL